MTEALKQMKIYPLHRFKALAALTPVEERLLLELGDRPKHHKRGQTFCREGNPTSSFKMLLTGWVASSITLQSGERSIQKIHLPGDVLGAPDLALATSAHTLTALTDAETADVPYARFGKLYETAPRLAALFMISAQLERLTLADMLAAKGNASAREQLAHLFLDLHGRLTPLQLVEDDTFDLPVSQETLADLLGLTSVHVNRMIRSLEKDGLIARAGALGHRVQLLNLPALETLDPLPPRQPQFQPDWLPTAR